MSKYARIETSGASRQPKRPRGEAVDTYFGGATTMVPRFDDPFCGFFVLE